MKDGEKGFLLLETLVLAAVLVLMASALLLYRQGLRMEAQTRFEAAGLLRGHWQKGHPCGRST